MRVSFDVIPRDKLVNLSLRVHPGFKRAIAHQAIDAGVSAEEKLHEILLCVLGDPGPIEAKRRELQPSQTS